MWCCAIRLPRSDSRKQETREWPGGPFPNCWQEQLRVTVASTELPPATGQGLGASGTRCHWGSWDTKGGAVDSDFKKTVLGTANGTDVHGSKQQTLGGNWKISSLRSSGSPRHQCRGSKCWSLNRSCRGNSVGLESEDLDLSSEFSILWPWVSPLFVQASENLTSLYIYVNALQQQQQKCFITLKSTRKIKNTVLLFFQYIPPWIVRSAQGSLKGRQPQNIWVRAQASSGAPQQQPWLQNWGWENERLINVLDQNQICDLDSGLWKDVVQVFSCFNVLEIPLCVKWKTTWTFPEEGFFRENLTITRLWLNFCQCSPFQSSLRKPEGSDISAARREGHITSRDHSCWVVRTSFGWVQTSALRPVPPSQGFPAHIRAVAPPPCLPCLGHHLLFWELLCFGQTPSAYPLWVSTALTCGIQNYSIYCQQSLL